MNCNYLTLLTFWTFFLSAFCTHVCAQITHSGQLINYNALALNPPNELISGRTALRTNLLASFEPGRLYFSGDLRHHYGARADSIDLRLREIYMELHFPNADLKIGKQAIAWGKSESGFILDILTPFDLSEFITRDFTELREGATALSYTHYIGRTQLQFVLSPFFEPSTLPDYNGRWGVVSSDVFPLPAVFESHETTASFRDLQAAARAGFRPILNFDLDVAVLYWNNPSPGYFKSFDTIDFFELRIPQEITFTEKYKPGFAAGFWGEYRTESSLIFDFEAAYFWQKPLDIFPSQFTKEEIEFLRKLNNENGPVDSNEFIGMLAKFTDALNEYEDSGFLTYNPALLFMTGIRHNIYGWDSAFQYSGEWIAVYREDILQDRYFHSITATISNSFLRNRLIFRTLARFHINGSDFWIYPEIRYDLTDGLTLSAGAHIFGGARPDFDYGHLSFYQYRKNSLGFISARFAW